MKGELIAVEYSVARFDGNDWVVHRERWSTGTEDAAWHPLAEAVDRDAAWRIVHAMRATEERRAAAKA